MSQPTPPAWTDDSESGLIAAIQADQIAARIIDPEIAVEAHFDGDVTWAVAPIADTFRNVVVAARFGADDADRRIGQIVERFARSRTGFVWWLAPFDTPNDLGRRLVEAGLSLEGSAAAMAADIADMPLDEQPPPGLEIVPVTDSRTLDEFLTIIEADWVEWTGGVATDAQRQTLDAWARQIPPKLPDEPVPLRWLGRLDGRVVATSRISISAGVAGMYAITTRADHRGRGFGRAMTIAALRAAASIGYRIAVLQSSELGYRVYRRLGFREVFAYEVYVHPGPAAFPGPAA